MSYLNHWIKRIQNKWLSEWDEQVIESLNQHTFGFAVITLNENNCEQTLWGFDEESLRITSLNYEWTLMFVFFTLQNKGAIFKTVLWFGQTCPHKPVSDRVSESFGCFVSSGIISADFRQRGVCFLSKHTREVFLWNMCNSHQNSSQERKNQSQSLIESSFSAARSSLTSDLYWKQHSEECLEAHRQVIFIHIVFFAIHMI